MRQDLFLLIVAALLGAICTIVMGRQLELENGSVATALAAAQEGQEVVVVLDDGSEITGTIVKETDDAVHVSTIYGTQKIPRSKIKEIRRGEDASRRDFEDRFRDATRRKSVKALLDVAEWAREKGLDVEARRAFTKVVEFDADNEKARLGLGHAKFEGKWVDEKRVSELLQQGYVLEGVNLIKRKGAGDSGKPGTDRPEVSEKKRPVSAVLPPLTDEIKQQREAERRSTAERRARKAEKFRQRKLKEFEGVALSTVKPKRTNNYFIKCDSTPKVANAYVQIMENLYSVLSSRFKGKTTHSQKSTIFIYKTQEEFMAETGVGRGTGAFFQPSSKNIHAYHGVFGNTGTTLPVLCHEATHMFQAKKLSNMQNIPAWLIEGLAVFFGDYAKIDPKKKKIRTGLVPRDRLLHLQDKIRNGRHLPLKSLVMLQYRQLNGSLYADAWSLCYFLFDGPETKKGRNFIATYWTIAEKRKLMWPDFEKLADKYFGGISKMEKMWTEYTMTLKPEPAGVVKGDRFESYDFKFETRLPGPGWEFEVENPARNALVAMRVPETDVQIRIHMRNKPDHLQSGEEFVDKYIEAAKKKYGEIERETADFYGLEYFVLDYADPDASDGDDEDAKKDDEKKKEKKDDGEKEDGEEKADEDEDRPPLRYRSYVFVGVNRAYLVIGEAPPEEFDGVAPYFEEAARDFEPVFENRW